MVKIVNGNIFTSDAQTLVNTVNCVGFMGKGIALEFKLRYPEMYNQYQKLCAPRDPNRIMIGKLWAYDANDRKILNFPTKDDYRQPSRIEYLEKGLINFVSIYKKRNITSIAFPLLGAQNGGLDPDEVLSLMKKYLDPIKDITITIYIHDANSPGDILFSRAKDHIESGVKPKSISDRSWNNLKNVVSKSPRLNSFSGLLMSKVAVMQPDGSMKKVGVTESTVKKLVSLASSHSNTENQQSQLSIL